MYPFFIDNVWDPDPADMQLLSKFNQWIRFLLWVFDIYSKCAWVIPLKDKKGISVTNAFQKLLDQLGPKPNKMWVDKGCEFYNRLMTRKIWYRNIFNT